MELGTEGAPTSGEWSPVAPPTNPPPTTSVAVFRWERLPLSPKVLMRHLALGFAIVIGLGALAFAVSSLSPTEYGARTEINYPINPNQPSLTYQRAAEELTTQLVAMKSPELLGPVAQKFGLSESNLSDRTKTSIVNNSDVLRIEVDDRSAQQAQQIDGAIATAYLKTLGTNSEAQAEVSLNSQITSIKQQRASLNSQIDKLQSQRLARNPASTPSAAELNLESQSANLLSQSDDLQTNLNDLTLQQLQQAHTQQLTQPYIMPGKVSPQPLRAALAAAFFGLMLAAVIVGFRLRRLLRRRPDPAAETPLDNLPVLSAPS